MTSSVSALRLDFRRRRPQAAPSSWAAIRVRSRSDATIDGRGCDKLGELQDVARQAAGGNAAMVWCCLAADPPLQRPRAVGSLRSRMVEFHSWRAGEQYGVSRG